MVAVMLWRHEIQGFYECQKEKLCKLSFAICIDHWIEYNLVKLFIEFEYQQRLLSDRLQFVTNSFREWDIFSETDDWEWCDVERHFLFFVIFYTWNLTEF